MKTNVLVSGVILAVGALGARGDLFYSFDSDIEGFQNVIWQSADPVGWSGLPGTVKQNHAAGGWQNLLTKEFSWGPGGGSANQQLEMQALANLGDMAHISFDVMVDGKSFPPGQQTWFQLTIVGNSDGSTGWKQNENVFGGVTGWHPADDSTLYTLHVDQPFSWMGWQPGDTWFQFWTGANSDGAVPVNFYFDNVRLYAVPEPAAVALLGLGIVALWLRRPRV